MTLKSAAGDAPGEAPGVPAAAIATAVAAEARFLTMLNMMPQAVWSALPNGYHDFFNDRWYEITGVAHGSTDGDGWNSMSHPDDQARAWEKWRHSLATGEPYEVEYRLLHHDGEYRWTLGRALPIRGSDGEIEHWFGTCTDIHDLKLAEEQRALIARELSHRIKNIFAVVSSLVTLSVRNAPLARPFAQSLRARIEALAHAHNYVRPHSDESAAQQSGQTALELIGKVLAAYTDGTDDRITIEGDDAPIRVTAATSLALAIHELATNAIKYGALSNPAGKVAIACRLEAETYGIVWRETGGPEIEAAPTYKGFGTIMSERAVAGMIGSTIAHEWRRGGLVVQIAIPEIRLAN